MNWFGFELSAFLWVFIVLNVINVIIQTIKSIVTISGTKMVAAVVNAITFAFYTVVVIYMNADGLGIIWKALIIGVANFGGVYVVKLIEEKSRKDKLWKVEASIPKALTKALHHRLKVDGIPHNFIENVGEYTVFNIYCATQKESAIIKELLNACEAKYFVSESKTL